MTEERDERVRTFAGVLEATPGIKSRGSWEMIAATRKLVLLTPLLALLTTTTACKTHAGGDTDVLRVSFQGWKSGELTCSEASQGQWAAEFVADGFQKVVLRIAPPAESLRELFDEFARAARESEAGTGMAESDDTSHCVKVELGRGARLDRVTICGYDRIARMFEEYAGLRSLYVTVIKPLPLAKQYWFRDLVVFPEDIERGEWQRRGD
jgi:hypothetical protein